MRGTPYTKNYPGNQRGFWDRFDRLPKEYREMITNDANGNSLATLEAAEALAREAGLLPSLTKEKEKSKDELRRDKDRERTEAAKARSRVIYTAPAGTVFTRKPIPGMKKVVLAVPKEEKPRPRTKSEHNGEIT